MHGRTGDQIVVESAKINSASRSDEILNYWVRWDNGHDSTIFPGSDARAVQSSG